jgi:hypothetical protein
LAGIPCVCSSWRDNYPGAKGTTYDVGHRDLKLFPKYLSGAGSPLAGIR